MTTIASAALWERLRAASLVEGEQPVSGTEAPWYVRVMLGIAGWIGALFLLGFVGAALAFVFKSASSALIIGAFACAAAAVLFRVAPRNLFAAQFALATSFAGQAMFAFGMFQLHGVRGTGLWLIFGIFEAVLALSMANFVHRVWSSFVAVAALSVAMANLGIYHFMPGIVAAAFAIVWLNEFNWARHGEIVRAIGYGLALGLLQIDAQYMAGDLGGLFGSRDVMPWMHGAGRWIGSALMALALIVTAWRLLEREGVALSPRAGAGLLAASVLLAAATFRAPGLTAALLVLLLGFANGNRPLAGLGIIGFAAYLSHYYYQLHTTLLVKSMTLAATGCVLLLIRYVALRWLAPANAEGKNA